jgi:phosphatidylserine/phosphatidylglycerophosphate/cardiolipin synthase-like enzyme
MGIVVGAFEVTFLLLSVLGFPPLGLQAAPHVAAPSTDNPPAVPLVLIEALYYDGYEVREPDEAFRLVNAGTTAADISGWAVSDGVSTVTFPSGTTLAKGQAIWCTKQAPAFTRQFGFPPDFEVEDSDPSVPEMEGTWPGFANHGDECVLLDPGGQIRDALVYEDGDTTVEGWTGAAVGPWTPSSSFAAEGQILYRKREQATGLPVPDTDASADWAQDPGDHLDGRRVQFPGWDLDRFFFPQQVTEEATLTVAVAPDNLHGTVRDLLANARHSIEIEAYSFRSRELAEILLERLGAGVRVTLLLEGAPAFDGVTDEEKWITKRLHESGAQVLFMVNDSGRAVYDRYRYQHAKLMIVDADTVLVGSENPTPTGMPADEKANGTAGRRGVALITNAPGVVERIQAIFDADADPTNHVDLVGCDGAPALCVPPAGFEPELTPDWLTYTIPFPMPQTWRGTFAFEVIQSPETSLRTRDGLLGLLERAGPGDEILVEQLEERVHWGPSDGGPVTDPNPRLVAYLDAARRGAAVRILLDSYLDGDNVNAQTTTYLQSIAQAEGLDLKVRLANPTYLGLHNKMILAQIGGQGHVHVGSLNGSEVSSKANREVALQVQSDEAYGYLRDLFEYDWRSVAPAIYLPIVTSGYRSPRAAEHLLLSEVYYSTIPEKEWVEIYNPTGNVIELSTYKIGDAANQQDFEGTYQFPAATKIAPGRVLVVAVAAAGFREDFPGGAPDFEMLDTDPVVPDMSKYSAWGEGDWGLRNGGDQVLLLDGGDRAVDVVVYGDAGHPGVVPHPGVVYGHSLERDPIWLDTDDCRSDFRDWPYPGPGSLPR